jgi:molybdenum cofactor cytidylyltransferase
MTRIAALLAAGGGTRFTAATHKLLAALHDRTVWEWALAHVQEAGFDHVVVVTGAASLPLPPDVIGRHNPQWADGQAGSLQLAVAAAREFGADAVTIGLADQPFVTADAWRSVADAPPTCRLVIATYDGVPGPHPIRLGRDVWPLLPTDGDEGARSVLHVHPEWVCRVPCLGSGADIDTTEDLDRWKSC